MVAVDNSGGETVSECWSFYTNSENSAPSEFALLSPLADEETGLFPTFNWSESTDPDLYDECIIYSELWIRYIKHDKCNSTK